MARGTRTRLAEGVYADKYGVTVAVKVSPYPQRERRYPLGTPLLEMQAWRDRARAELRDDAARSQVVSPRGTLRRDSVRYLKQIGGRAGFAADRSHLRAWFSHFGNRPRRRITTEDVNTVIAAWRTGTGHPDAPLPIAVTAYRRGRQRVLPHERHVSRRTKVSDKTIRERCRVLRDVYRTLDGRRAWTPLDEAKWPKRSKPTPVGVAEDRIASVLVALRVLGTAQDYARALVLTSCLQRPTQMARAQPVDVRLNERLWIVRSAKGEPAHAIYLNDEMVAAWRAFIRAKAWGAYDSSAFAKLLRRCGWPAGVRPYNARHSGAMDAIARGANLSDLQALLGHASIETTRRFYAPLMGAEAKRASERLTGRLKRR